MLLPHNMIGLRVRHTLIDIIIALVLVVLMYIVLTIALGQFVDCTAMMKVVVAQRDSLCAQTWCGTA